MRKKTSTRPKTPTRRKKPKVSVLRSPGVLRQWPWSEAASSSEESGEKNNTAAETHANDNSFEGHGAEGTITTLHTTTLLQKEPSPPSTQQPSFNAKA
jgi:hypothetical protein